MNFMNLKAVRRLWLGDFACWSLGKLASCQVHSHTDGP